MRNVKSKLLVILGTLLAVGMGYMAAYTINVGPQNYYGTLTLNTGYFRYSNANTGIILGYDGTTTGSFIKVGKRHGGNSSGIELLGGLSKILVTDICDATNNNCKKISDILELGGTGTNNYCVYSGDNKIRCNQQGGETYYANNGVTKDGTTFKANLHDYVLAEYSASGNNSRTSISQDKLYAVGLDSNSKLSVYVPWTTEGNISGKIVVNSSASGTGNGQSSSGTNSIYINYVESGVVLSSNNIVGAGGTKVSSDNNGKITIYSTGGDTNSRGSSGHRKALQGNYITPLNNKNITIGTTGLNIVIATITAVTPGDSEGNIINGNGGLKISTTSGGFIYFNEYDTLQSQAQNTAIGINNNNPLVALDVNGPIKVSSNGNCTRSCTTETAGMIVYQAGNFWGCVVENNTPKWKAFYGDDVSTQGFPTDRATTCNEIVGEIHVDDPRNQN